uniref:NADH-ubiquinone oxidoreductase chain 5 n=1 Tax=Limnoria quadripunctata TaxID=161573 RepID=A0A023IWQ3_LIMQU|nr:NADH dehydrogenase subunit 5 [Limnoria quadripunctata]
MFKFKSISKIYTYLFFMTSIFSITSSVLMFQGMKSFVYEFNLISMVSCKISFLLYFDWLSMSFWSVVSWISASVMLFSESYMKHDKFKSRFFSLVFLFVISMFFLIFSLNFMSILMGWDGLGIISYILVIYYQNEYSSSAGMLTALSNRVGDAAILLSIGMMMDAGSWNFMWMTEIDSNATYVGFLVILASMTKSAQIPFSPWLPAAMAAPTPVSALVHSSTLVTAGVYLAIRFDPYLNLLGMKKSIFLVGLITTLMSSLGATFENDLKKVIALSTLSQLGVMMSILGLGEAELAFFHLLTHASFKALLFMCSGKIIHESKSTQDLRFMGALNEGLPITSTSMNLANLALMGFPFLAGFYSKDLFMEMFFMDSPSWVLKISLETSLLLTSVYSVRLAFMGLLNLANQVNLSKTEDTDKSISVSKFLLILSSITGGATMSWLFLSSPLCIILLPENKISPLLCLSAGMLFGAILSTNSPNLNYPFSMNFMFHPITGMWFIPLFQKFFSKIFLGLSGEMDMFDKSWLEKQSKMNLKHSLIAVSSQLTSAQMSMMKIFIIILPLSFLFL